MKKFLQSKLFIIGLATSVASLGIFGLVVGLTSTIKYNAENPRKVVNEFAAKLTNLSFSLNAFDANSDYQTVKNSLVDSSNQIKDQDGVVNYFSYFRRNGENLEKVDLADKEIIAKNLSLKIIEIVPDDGNQNFRVKFQVSQVLENGDVANSDIFEQTVVFAKESKFLIAEFNSTLKKITDKLNQQIQNLVSNKSSRFADAPSASQSIKDTRNPASLRPIDFQNELNTAINPSQLNTKLASYFPSLKNIVETLNASPENKIPNDTAKIFDFSFVKDRSTYQFVGLQDQIPVLFLEANLTNAARNQIGESAINFKPIINAIKIVKSDKSSYFLDLNDFLKNLDLKNPEKTDYSASINKIFAQEFLAKIKSGFFKNQAQKSGATKKEIEELLKSRKIEYKFGNFTDMFKQNPTEGLNFTFDTQKSFVDPEDKTSVHIPFEISVQGKFFSQKSSEQEVGTKKGDLKLVGFKGIQRANSPEFPSLNAEIFKQKFVQGIEKAKEKQDLFAFGGKPRPSLEKLAKAEFDELFNKNVDENTNKLKQVLQNNYDFDLDPYFSLADSWTGKLKLPTIGDIKKFTKDQREILRNKNLAVLDSREFLRDGHQVASFFQDLLTKDQKTIVTTLFELTKKFGLLDERKDLPEDLLNANDNLFSAAKKITLTNTTTEPNKNEVKLLSFNDVWRDFSEGGIGFYGTLVLPTTINEKLKPLASDSAIFAELKNHLLIKQDLKATPAAVAAAIPVASEITEKKLTEGVKFTTFGDILLAFFLKAAQFANFSAWAKLDDNLKYTLIFEKGNETDSTKETVDKKIEELSNAITTPKEPAPTTPKEPAPTTPKEPAPTTPKEPAPTTPKEPQYIQIKFKFKLEYLNKKSDFSFLTPVNKVFLELEKDDVYKQHKEIKELNKVVLSIPQEFSETTIDEDSFSKLTFPNVQTPPSTGENSLSKLLPEFGKKIEEFLKKEKYEAKIESISPLANNSDVKIVLFRIKKTAEGAQNQGKKAEGTPNQGKKVEVQEKLSSLKFRIVVKKGAKKANAPRSSETNRGSETSSEPATR
ncbi:P97 family adhesin [Mycoplasma sp. 'Moose RK']|uniref:P97 family adhesin n=1 Tax=Mycoplasma sp. 'Moose RK' TaxID=2780095 RepID=UPI0018C29886|nr:adhesin [Mycoplasma sp. 'Moose RK']MBG0730926.1 adhesin [Mycoplasma sp. 'Moose RK']